MERGDRRGGASSGGRSTGRSGSGSRDGSKGRTARGEPRTGGRSGDDRRGSDRPRTAGGRAGGQRSGGQGRGGQERSVGQGGREGRQGRTGGRAGGQERAGGQRSGGQARAGGQGRAGHERAGGRSGGRATGRQAPAKRGREGGFGPYGAPAEPTRDRRGDDRRGDGRGERPPAQLRIKGERRATAEAKGAARGRSKSTPTRRRRRAPADVESEILRLGGRRGRFLLDQLMAAADAFGHDRDRDAVRLLRPLRDALPDAPSVRELLGLAQYRLGNYRAAAKELEEFVRLTDSVEQHPVLMDALRAQRRWRRVDELWEELAATSPSAELVAEGRIVAAGALADQRDLDGAIALLTRKSGDMKRARPHHLRLWYALADLEERAGNLARARTLFNRVQTHDSEFADVSTRVRALA